MGYGRCHLWSWSIKWRFLVLLGPSGARPSSFHLPSSSWGLKYSTPCWHELPRNYHPSPNQQSKAELFKGHYPSTHPHALCLKHSTVTMPGLVSDATRVWELNVFWALHSQCGVWDPKSKRVEVWECIRERECFFFVLLSLPYNIQFSNWLYLHLLSPSRPSHAWYWGTFHYTESIPHPLTHHNLFENPSLQPPNSNFWRYVTRRWHLYSNAS